MKFLKIVGSKHQNQQSVTKNERRKTRHACQFVAEKERERDQVIVAAAAAVNGAPRMMAWCLGGNECERRKRKEQRETNWLLFLFHFLTCSVYLHFQSILYNHYYNLDHSTT